MNNEAMNNEQWDNEAMNNGVQGEVVDAADCDIW
jgi:hypothetical protein